jgi:tetratricopeptide (TPR) repeat protein
LAYKLKDDLDAATVELQKAAQLDPSLADPHYTLGVLYWQKGDFDPAIEQLKAAIGANPAYAEAYYTLGTVYKQQGKLPDAEAALREAIRLQPDFSGAHTTLAAVLRQLGDTAGAAEQAQAASRISASVNGRQAATFATNSGTRLLNAGDIEGAIQQFRSAIALDGGYAPAHRQLSQALQRKGDKDGARREEELSRQLDSANP